jgi:NAD(P)-dependent dehydrogenase (short-subunit alcohol dehydrogenase family)
MSLSSTPLRALVVGGTSGIGHGVALALAKRGDVEVTIAGRSAERGASIVEQMNGVSSSKQNHKFVAVDGFDLQSVRALATSTQPAPDILVMTQGMATLQGYTPTIKDGIDQKLQLHYFSRFYLTSLLAPNMKPNGRVLTVLSAGVHGKYKGHDKDFELKNNSYSVKNAADAAGYYTDAGFEALSEQNSELVMAHAAPGVVNTNWGTEFPAILRVMVVRPMMSLFGKNKEDLGETLVSSLMKLPKGYSLLDQKGAVIENGIKHTREERDVILEKTLAILPDL